ncbi:ABC transporter permease subunit [Clostridium cellulovorans]|uniref:Putative ABC transporter, permease protein n=1 Tax=Clostridium cellulovorans (strain ATCC 35296 / DSM 3052 / OCM 3 / 743B) TaxID=573061 RepID=D9SMR3_CLOC7|nr:ABC transporter permease subunit [Clostridium cellulovorans]ADL49848.1 putative ABC transporter, permease protein [Clostridium cellulovorans 743B]
MLALIKNEYRKLFRRTQTWVLIGLFLAVMCLGTVFAYYTYRIDQRNQKPETQKANIEQQISYLEENKKQFANNESKDNQVKEEYESNIDREIANLRNQIDYLNQVIEKGEENIDWKSNLKTEIDNQKKTIEEMEKNAETNEGTENFVYLNNDLNQQKADLEKLQYLYDNDIKPIKGSTFDGYSVINKIFTVLGGIILTLGVIIFSSDIVSGEMNPATVKFLLVQPTTRRKILLSKFITIVTAAIGLIVGIQILFFLGIGITNGFGNGNYPVIVGAKFEVLKTILLSDGSHPIAIIENSMHIISTSQYFIQYIGFEILFILAGSAFGFMLSTICKSATLSTVIGIIISIASPIFFQVVKGLKKFVHLLFVAYNDPSMILSGMSAQYYNNIHYNGITGIIVLIVTAVICYIVSDIIFTRKDFAA